MKNTRGYTMVEVLVTVSLFAVILTGIYGVLMTGNIVYHKDAAFLDMESQCRNALDRIVREVREASSQTITTNYNSTSNDKIRFTIPSAVGIQYYLSGTNLVLEYPAGTIKIMASNIDVLKFSLTGSLLTVQVRASQAFYNQPVIFSLTEKVRLRNE